MILHIVKILCQTSWLHVMWWKIENIGCNLGTEILVLVKFLPGSRLGGDSFQSFYVLLVIVRHSFAESYFNEYFAAVIDHARLIFSYNWSRTRKIQHLSLILGLLGDTQIRTLLRALHVYSNQSSLRILRDVSSSISWSEFVRKRCFSLL